MKLFALGIFVAVLCTANAKMFGACELARVLFNNGFPKSQLADWICLVGRESRFDTSALNKKNADGSSDYGLFQINNRYWCKNSKFRANDCNVDCTALLDDDITDDMRCIKLIHKRHGFGAWVAWSKYCKGKTSMESINECFKSG
ncbi:lysozyme c-1-like [Anopheles nili]|uniref:lysozyme c-1-like n=1 Tax=Anopheles nili TaxID=185578 RepID=UPI00237AABDA|nr:lysozyme c-1-like [Anopheles nili]